MFKIRVCPETRAYELCLAIGDVKNILNVADFRIIIFAEDEIRMLDNDEIIADDAHWVEYVYSR